ncbi:MAG: transglycosylase domain-containing protein [Clostridia bacterium]|nr:transglycosylase domain-containing protein [Clostridia bacterium]
MKVFKRVVLVLVVIVVIAVAAFVGNGYFLYREALEKVPLSNKVELIRAKEDYTYVSEMPEIYKQAVIAVEDHRFYEHGGIDVIAIGRAVVNDIKAMSYVEGGSTITQQLAKNIYFTQEKKMTRKVAEMFMAFNIERNYEKDEILELYLNTSYFGDGYYTAKEAANGYFDKELMDMTDYEAILLAGIPNAPSVYAPTKNPELAKQRQKQVMNKMIKHGIITEEKAEAILTEN